MLYTVEMAINNQNMLEIKPLKENIMKTLLVLMFLVIGAFAAGQGNMMPSFTDIDLNKDGKLTQKEFKEVRQKRMAANAESGHMMRNAQNAPMFKAIDVDNSGFIDTKEFQSHQGMNKMGMGQCMGKGMMGVGKNKGMGQGHGMGMGQ